MQALVVAHALMGVHRAAIDYVRRRVLAGDRPERLAADVRRVTKRAFAQLERGLADYGRRPAVSPTPAAANDTA
jgi:hypothetical protein